MAIITQSNYEKIESLNREQYSGLSNQEKVAILSVYFLQSDKILELLERLPPEAYKSEQAMRQSLAEMSIAIDGFNDEITPVFQESQKKFNELAFSQLVSLGLLAGIVLKKKETTEKKLIKSLERPIADSSFRLSEGIWGKDKRVAIYKNLLRDIQLGKDRKEIIEGLESYLKKSGQGGAYYKAERVVDNEVRRAYTRAKYANIREFNKQASEKYKLVVEIKLSSVHTVPDICNEIAGTYDPENKVPDLPLHPRCKCYQVEKFVKDTSSRTILLTDKDGVYTSGEHGTEVTLL